MKTERILVVDDEVAILSAIKRLLEFADYQVTCAKCSEEALTMMQEQHFAVIISDNRMPGISGVEFLSRAKNISPNTERILMTGAADFETALDAINRGEVFRFVTKPWDNDDFLRIVGEAFWRRQIVQSLRRGEKSVFLSIARMVELKDAYTRGHSERVAAVAEMICSTLEMKSAFSDSVKWGSWLHDCGKVGVPETILNSSGKPSAQEWQLLKRHPEWGASVARQAGMSEQIVNIVLYHHESYDGSGYPQGLKGASIPLEARIVAVADTFDALTSDRSYRAKHGEKECFAIMEGMKGKKLDPQLVTLFINQYRREHEPGNPFCRWPRTEAARPLVKLAEHGRINGKVESIGGVCEAIHH